MSQISQPNWQFNNCPCKVSHVASVQFCKFCCKVSHVAPVQLCKFLLFIRGIQLKTAVTICILQEESVQFNRPAAVYVSA